MALEPNGQNPVSSLPDAGSSSVHEMTVAPSARADCGLKGGGITGSTKGRIVATVRGLLAAHHCGRVR